VRIKFKLNWYYEGNEQPEPDGHAAAGAAFSHGPIQLELRNLPPEQPSLHQYGARC